MHKRFFSLSFFLILLGLALSMQAQNNTARPVPPQKKPVRGGERFDVIFSRGILFSFGLPDSVPINPSRSGPLSVGFAYNIPLGRITALRIEPMVTWQKITYRKTTEKTFPTADTTSDLILEKQRMFYAELPLAVKFNIRRNADAKVSFYLEGGWLTGYNLASSFKTRREIDQPVNPVGTSRTKITEKVQDIEGLESFRYGPFFRLGTRFVAFNFFYRLSHIFDQDATYTRIDNNGNTITGKFPKFYPLELSFMFVF